MAFTSTTAKLPSGVEIFFSDSGVPGSSDYTTVIVHHGTIFNGRGFEKLHAHAAKYNLRFVVWNRREYSGSSKFTDEEIEDLKQGKMEFLDGLGRTVAEFIKCYIDMHHIPKITTARRGGVALLGWSLGSATSMAMFSNPNALPDELYKEIEPYVKDLILYDPPHFNYGYDLPADHKAYLAWEDPSADFTQWISSYYDHPPISDPSFFHINSLDFSKSKEKQTAKSLTPEMLERELEFPAFVRSEVPMFSPPMQASLAKQAKNVLFDGELAKTWFPRVQVAYVRGTQSTWHCAWAYVETMRKMERCEGRVIKVVNLEGCNHFIHVDEPVKFLEAIVEVVADG